MYMHTALLMTGTNTFIDDEAGWNVLETLLYLWFPHMFCDVFPLQAIFKLHTLQTYPEHPLESFAFVVFWHSTGSCLLIKFNHITHISLFTVCYPNMAPGFLGVCWPMHAGSIYSCLQLCTPTRMAKNIKFKINALRILFIKFMRVMWNTESER